MVHCSRTICLDRTINVPVPFDTMRAKTRFFNTCYECLSAGPLWVND